VSFILDALKKSEAERQRQDAPGFVHIPDSSQNKSTGKWIWLVATLITVNLAVLAVVILRSDSAITSSQTPAAGNQAETQPVAVNKDRATVTAEPVQQETIKSSPVAESTPPQAAANLPISTNSVGSYDVESTSPIGASAATFNNLRAQGVLSLPDMHLDIHVYAGQPADRFVFINMSKYKENAQLTEGPTVREITPEGVILEYGGTEFLLPRE
jgi:general secretion pathway protein B